MNAFDFKCLEYWHQCLSVSLIIQLFLYGFYLQHKSKQFYLIFELNSINHSKFHYHEKNRFEFHDSSEDNRNEGVEI